MQNKKQHIFKIIAWSVVIISFFLCLSRGDRFIVTWDGTQLNRATKFLVYNSAFADETTQDAGFFAKSEKLELKKGEYMVTAHYTATGEGNVMRVMSDDGANKDNSAGRVFATQTLDMSKNESVIKFSIDEDAYGVYVVFDYSGEGSVTLNDVTIRSDMYFNDSVWIIFLCALGVMIYCYLVKKWEKVSEENAKQNQKIFWILCAAVIVVSIPLFTDYIIFGHDMSYHTMRIKSIADGLRGGQFPVRIQPSWFNYHGSADSVFYPDLLLYPAAIMHMLGASIILAYKFLLLMCNIFTAWSAYFSAKTIFNDKNAGVVCAVVYLMCTYRMTNMYERAALGESLAMVFFPLIFLGLYQVLISEDIQWKWLALGFCGVVQSHIISTLFAALFAVLAAIVFIKRVFEKKRLIAIFKAVVVTILVNIWFIVPFLEFRGLPVYMISAVNIYHLAETALYPAQLFSSFWGFDMSNYSVVPGTLKNEMPLTLGALALVILIAGVTHLAVNRKSKDSAQYKLIFAITALLSLTLFVSTVYFPWGFVERLPVVGIMIRNIQYAWRLLGPACLFTAFLAGALVKQYENSESLKRIGSICLTICLVSVLFFNDNYLKLNTIYKKCGAMPNGITLQGTSSEYHYRDYLYKSSNPAFLCSRTPVIEADETVEIKDYKKYMTNVKFSFDKPAGGTTVTLPLVYYPGYVAKDENGEDVKMSPSEKMYLLQIELPQKATSGTINVKYKGLNHWRIFDLISGFTVLGLAGNGIFKRIKVKKNENSGK
ncbi:MAG: hypothetical protein RR198_06980 [Oscillospiraceae bacterium]